MTARSLPRIAMGLAALVAGLSCTPQGAAPPQRPRTARGRPLARGDHAPPPPAPKGPDISGQILVTARLGALAELDRRISALIPSVVPAPLVQGLVTRRLFPELVRGLGLNALLLDAFDFTRPVIIGLLAPPSSRRGPVPKLQAVALVPLRGDPSLVADGLRVSYPESSQEPWGGVRIRQGEDTLAWVHVREGWAVVAPTAPLLDSAMRALGPLVRGAPEGTVGIDVRYAQLLALYRPAIAMAWRQLRSIADRTASHGRRSLVSALTPFIPLAERLAPYLASLDRVELFGRIADDGWSFRLKVTPTAGGKAAEWVSGLRSPGSFGLDLLPSEAALVSVDRRGEASRLLASQVYEVATDWATQLVVSRDLPPQVKDRGLMDRKTAAPLALYQRTLRDLNLEDYGASHALYKLLFEVQALRRLVTASTARLAAAVSGESATALYAPGGHLGVGKVERLKNTAAHRGAMMALAVGLQRQATAILSAIWDTVPVEVRTRLGMRQSPFRLVYNPMALQAGKVTVSSLALRVRWPAPAVPRGHAVPPERLRGMETLDTARKVVGHLFGTGDPTVAWAYVGDRVMFSMGHDWQARMRTMLQRTQPGAKGPSVTEDPRFQNALQGMSGESLSLTLVSGARLLLAGLDLLKVLVPSLATPGGLQGMIVQQVSQDAAAAQHASVVRERREDGAYVLEGRVPNDDLRGGLLGAGFLLFGATQSSPGVRVPIAPVSPSQP